MREREAGDDRRDRGRVLSPKARVVLTDLEHGSQGRNCTPSSLREPLPEDPNDGSRLREIFFFPIMIVQFALV